MMADYDLPNKEEIAELKEDVERLRDERNFEEKRANDNFDDYEKLKKKIEKLEMKKCSHDDIKINFD